MPLLILLVVVLVVMIAIAPKPQTSNAKAQGLDAFNFPRSNEGDPIPYIKGRVRLRSCNTLWYGDFVTIPIKQRVSSGFSSKKVTVGYKYYLGLDLGLALGPGIALKRIWAGKDLIWSGNVSTITDIYINKPNLFGGTKRGGGLQGTVTFYPGAFGQPRDPYLAEHADPDVPGYGGMAHLVFKEFYWGTQAQIPNLHFELECHETTFPSAYNVMPNGADMNPVTCLYEVLTQTWSALGMGTENIETSDWQQAAETLYNENLGMSLLVSVGNTGKDVIGDALEMISAIMYQDPEVGTLRLKLIRDDYAVDALPVFDQDNIIKIKKFSKQLWNGTFNQVRIKFQNRENDYSQGVALHQDFANIGFQRRVKSTDISYPMCYDRQQATTLAARDASVLSVPLYRASIIATRKAAMLRPGSLFVLAWNPYNLESVVMRVQKVDLGELLSGSIKIEAIQDRFASKTAVFAAPPVTEWNPTDKVAPNIIDSKAREMSYWELLTQIAQSDFNTMDDNQGLLSLVAAKPTDACLDYLYTIRPTGVGEYEEFTYATFTPTGLLLVGVTHTGTSLQLAGIADEGNIVEGSIVEIEDELCYITAFNPTTNVATVRRAVLDSVAADHPAGSRVWFLGSDSEIVEKLYNDGNSIQVKLMARTDSDERDPDTVTPISLVFDQRSYRPYPPSKLRINGMPYPVFIEGVDITVTWVERNRLTQGVTIVDEDDATVAPEADTTYTLKYYEDGVLVHTEAGMTLTTHTFEPSTACDLTIELYSVRSGVDSYYKHSYTFEYTPPIDMLLTEEGMSLLTEDDGRLLQE